MKRVVARGSKWRNSLRTRHMVDREITDEAMSASVRRIFWTAPIMAVGNFLASLGFWVQDEPTAAIEILWRELVIGANFLVSVISIGVWALAWIMRRREVNAKVQKVFVFVVAIYVLAMGLGITLIDHLVIPNIAPLLLCVTIVGTFYHIPPRSSLLVFVLSFIAFRFSFVFLTSLSTAVLSSTLVNGFVAHVLGFALSLLNWQHFRRTKLQEKTIHEQQELLTQMAYHDSLTNLPNRRYLDELVEREVSLVQRHQVDSCLIMCDIDDFKDVNDTFGHAIGDDLLCEFSALLRDKMREGNTLVRLGGEEFVILAPHTTLEQGMALAERLRKMVEAHAFTVDDKTLQITACFGVAELRGTEGFRDYYQQADKALYEAKRQGKNRVVAAPSDMAG